MQSQGHRYSDKLTFATKPEFDAVVGIEMVVRGYLEDKGASRPLSIAVFGAPGSGKSTGVNEIISKLASDGLKLCYEEKSKINLTQITTTDHLEDQLRVALDIHGDAGVPVVFFDEFDATMGGSPLGWLQWFLSPMEDGKWFCGGSWHNVPRAVFIFAGGTAHRYADFGKSNPAHFRAAKGPDFVSRLRGFLDVLGPNDGTSDDRRFRRDLAINYQLARGLVSNAASSTQQQLEATPELLAQLREVGRFRHGNRSIGSVLEICRRNASALGQPSGPLDVNHLPTDDLLALHVDAGPLDPARIGGTIGLSCNFDDCASQSALKELSVELWRQGARLAYFRRSASEDAFAWRPTEQAQSQSTILSRNRYAVARVAMFVVGTSPVPEPNEAVEVVRVPSFESNRADNNGLTAEDLYRMRWMLNSRCAARVLAAGKLEPSMGRRIQGILEEGMLALATSQPVYVLGAFGGAARFLGGLLGLASRPVPTLLARGDRELPEHVATLGGAIDVPTQSAEIPDYLLSFAIGGRRWPYNGLSVDENRTLFESSSEEEISRLICTGLLHRFHG